jgi:predicted nucleic acid-binding Zn ribbon protein
MARKSNLIRVGDAISQLLKQEKLDERIAQFTVKSGWKDIVGEVVAKNTSEIYFRERTIFISISSAALKHELSFRKEIIIENINKYCGHRLVDQIVIR